MRLNFRRMEIHSFMSFDDEVFEFDKLKGMILVRGKNNDLPGNETNGSGKSTVFAALLYILFGQVQSKMKNENLVNKFVDDKDMRLSLAFDVDGKTYRIARGLSKGRLSYLELYENDGDITKSSIAETQEFIEKEIIKCDISIFLRTILLTSKQTYNFYELKKNEKKEFVEKLFDIQVFGDMYQLIHRDILDSDKSMLARQNRLLVLNRSGSDYETRMNDYDIKRAESIRRLDESIKCVSDEYEQLKKQEIADNSEQADRLESAIRKIEDAKRDLNTQILELDEKNRKIELGIHKLNVSKDSKQAIIDKHAGLISKLCDDCKIIAGDYYGVSDYRLEIKDILMKIDGLNTAALKTDSARKQKQDKIREFDSKLDELGDNLKSITEQYNKASRKLIELESDIKRLSREKTDISGGTNPYTEMYESNLREIKKESDQLDALTEKYRYMKAAENIVSQDTLRKFIIADLIGLLNNRIKTYLTRLGSKYTVVFDSDMDYQFVSNDSTCEFGNFSAGEAMRIMIATSFAFRDFMSIRNGLNANILVLDEYFDSAISSACVENILGILKEYARDYDQAVYCISHRTEVSNDNFDSIIEIQKTNDISHVAYIE